MRIHRGKSVIKTVSVLLAAVMVFGMVSVPHERPRMVSAEESVEDLRDEKEQLEQRQKELAAQRDSSAQSLQEQEAQKALLQEQINVKVQEIAVNQQMIDKLDDQIDAKTYEIAQKEQAIDRKEADIADRFQELRIRLRTISKSGSLSTSLQMLMNSENYYDYLIMSKAIERVSESDQALMDEMEQQLQAIQADKRSLEEDKKLLDEQKAPVVEAQNELNTKKQELDSLYSEINVITDQLNRDIAHYNAEIAAAEAAEAELQEKIDEIIRSTIGTGQTFLSGSMYWPAPNCLIITSRFKYRWGRHHNGIDIAGSGCYGTPIVAAADGVVVLAEYGSAGYGNYLMLDHGNDSAGRRIMTLYGHSSQLLVSTGQAVSAGQTIALVGASGNVTGPHLHFEVRVDGTPVDPIANGYISTNGISINEGL